MEPRKKRRDTTKGIRREDTHTHDTQKHRHTHAEKSTQDTEPENIKENEATVSADTTKLNHGKKTQHQNYDKAQNKQH